MESSPVTKVFVVDDDATICRALERLLRSAGHSVETYTSAESFLAESRRPDGSVLILDVRMPGTTGPELMQQLAGERSALRIFFVSAEDDTWIREAVLAAGACGWFTKPIDGESLLTALGAPAQRREAH